MQNIDSFSIDNILSSGGILDAFDLNLDDLFTSPPALYTSGNYEKESDLLDEDEVQGKQKNFSEYEINKNFDEFELNKQNTDQGIIFDDPIVKLDTILPQTSNVAEYGTVSINHDWTTINLDNTYKDPVVITGDPTFNGPDPVAVRLRNVRGASFQMRLQEPNYMDGLHAYESVSYVVVESGEWQLLGGERFSAGHIQSDKLSTEGFETISYTNSFNSEAKVLTQIQTFNGPDWVTTRTKNISTTSFQVTMQEEENLNSGAHITEEIGWLATNTSGSTSDTVNTYSSLISNRTTSHAISSINIGSSVFGNVPTLIAKVSSFYGPDTSNARISNLTSDSVDVRVYEEKSLDSEMLHTTEDISLLAISDGDKMGSIAAIPYIAYVNPLAGDFAEWGTLSVNHGWQSVTLNNVYKDPIVIASDPTFNGTDPATVRIKNIDNNSFDIRLQEPNYMDGLHAYETVSYLVVESGDWSLDEAGNSLISAGKITSKKLSSQGFESVNLSGFSGIDYTVLSQIQTFNGPDWVTTRTKNLTSSSFQITMQEEENLNSGAHIKEEIGWIAIKEGSLIDTSNNTYFSQYDDSDLINSDVNNGKITNPLSTSAYSIIAKLGSSNGLDPANVRVSGKENSYFYLRAHEERSSDQEIIHIDETPSYLLLSGNSGTMTGLRKSAEWNTRIGYGHASARRSFEELLGIDLIDRSNWGSTWWGLDNVEAREVHNGTNDFNGVNGSGITVAVVDTGVDLDHPEFSGRIVSGYDFVNNDTIADDDHGHGTHVAGTIAASYSYGTGIAGVAYNAKIMPVKVLAGAGWGYSSWTAQGIRWAADNGADIINLSLGSTSESSLVTSAVQYATSKGAVCVMASMNNAASEPGWPARNATNYGIAVGAATSSFGEAYFSNKSGENRMDYVMAPGYMIYSTTMGGSYGYKSGTSMAAPHVAGIAALLKSYDNNLTPEKIERLICAGGSLVSGSSSGTINNSGNFSAIPFTTSEEINLYVDENAVNLITNEIDAKNKSTDLVQDKETLLITELLFEEELDETEDEYILYSEINSYDKDSPFFELKLPNYIGKFLSQKNDDEHNIDYFS